MSELPPTTPTALSGLVFAEGERPVRGREIRRQIEVLDSRTPALGAQVVARARTDQAFKQRLLADGRTACEELGISFYHYTRLIVLENSASVHNPVVAPCAPATPGRSWDYPRTGTNSSPTAPVLLRNHGRCSPSPRRPEGTEGWSQAQLAALVTRDAMIGVVGRQQLREMTAGP